MFVCSWVFLILIFYISCPIIYSKFENRKPFQTAVSALVKIFQDNVPGFNTIVKPTVPAVKHMDHFCVHAKLASRGMVMSSAQVSVQTIIRARKIQAHSRILRLEVEVLRPENLMQSQLAPKNGKPGASLRPDEHSSRPGSENKLETAFVHPLGRKKATWVLLAANFLSLGARLRPRWKKMRLKKLRRCPAKKILRQAQKIFFEPWIN